MNTGNSGAPAIHLDNICVEFAGRFLFDKLSLDISAGKCTCILGPSGCGKSTLLGLISGNPGIHYRGTISIFPTTQSVGWMSQSDLLLPWLNLHENVMLGARLRGEVNEKIQDKAKELLEYAGLTAYRKSLPVTLSGGMRQRGALLRTLMEERGLLLMDEPFSALDALTRLKLQDLPAEMTRGKTVLLVTHDPLEALRLGDEIVVFSGTPATAEKIDGLHGEVPRQLSDPGMASLHSGLLAKLMNEQHETL